jgi:hypothetical protein
MVLTKARTEMKNCILSVGSKGFLGEDEVEQ